MVWQQFRNFASKLVKKNAGLLLGLGLAAIAPNMALAAPLESSFLPHLSNGAPVTQTLEIANSPAMVFLYGTAPEAQQLGQEYMVISLAENNQVQGVFYQMNSEFACFKGEMKQGKLELAVMDPYEQVAYDYQLDYKAAGQVAETGDRLNVQFMPEGFHAIQTLSELDHELLQQCRQQSRANNASIQI